MADQRITELVELPQGGVSSNDVLPIADVSASQTKKVQVKSLIQAGFNLADASTLDISKINQASTAKFGTAAIGSNAITYAKIQQVSATDRLLGRSSAGAGNVEEIICTSFARSLLDDANAAAARSTLSLGVVATGDTINTSLIENLAITTGKVDDGAITTIKIADGNVTNAKIASGAVDSDQLAASGIIQGKLAADSVITVNIVDSGITQSKLAANAVDTINVVNSGITQVKLAADAIDTVNLVDSAVTLAKMASGSINTAQLVVSGVTQEKLAANAVATINLVDSGITQAKLSADAVATINLVDSGVTQAKLASGSVDTINIIDSSVTLVKMASGSVDTAQLVPSGVTQEKLAADAVATINILDSGVTQQKLAADAVATINIADSGITQPKLASGAIDTVNIIDEAITLVKMASGSVDTAQLVDSGVTTAKIASGAITIDKLAIASGEFSGAFITASSIPSGSYESGSVTTDDIADNAVTFAKIQQVASDVLLGRASAGSGNVEAITLTEAGRALLDDADTDTQRTTLGLGTIATQSAGNVTISGGTVNGVTLVANNVTISGGSITAITDLAIADGGTGASTASDARTNLGLAIGTDVQAYDAALASIAGLTTASDQVLYTTGSDTYATTTITAAGRAILDDADASAQRTTLGLGTLATQNTVGTGDYDAGSIATNDIADSGVTTTKIVDSGITSTKIADSAVITAKINDEAVTTAKIIDSGVTTDKIADDAVTFDKIQNTTQSDVLIGRVTASGGTLEEIDCTAAARSILDDASVEDIRTTLGLGTLATQNGTFSGTSNGTNTGDQTIILTGDVTGTGTGSFTTTIADSSIVAAKIADGAISSAKVASGAITAENLADQSAAIVIADTPSASGTFIGQQWFNTNNGYEYTWTGTEWLQQAGINTIAISGDTLYSFSVAYPDNYSSSIVPSLNTQAAGQVLIGPASGSDAAPTFRAIAGEDLPAATISSKGAIIPGAGLSMTGDVLAHTNTVTSGTYYKVEVDGEGHVVSGATALEAADIPDLDAAKITTGSIGSGIIGDQAILATKLANYSTTKFGEAPPTADFIGQYFFNPLEKDLFLWDGNVWNPVGVSIGEIVFAGTYNASGNTVASTTSEGAAVGLTIGQPLPAPSTTFNKYYVVVESGGTGTSPAPEVLLAPPDIILCNGTAWVEIDVSSTYVSQTASQVNFTPAASIGSTNVQAAIEEVSNECRNVNNVASGVLAIGYGGTGQSSYTKGNILVASGTGGLAKLSVGSNGTVLTADSAETSGVKWAVPASGTVLSVNATAPLSVASGTTTPHITISNASTSAVGVVQLTNSTSTTSSTLAATATAVKSAYDLANAALPVAGGTMTGTLNLGTSVNIVFEGSIADAFKTTLTVANPTADRTITLPNTTGTVITTGDTGTVTNTMLAGSIADTKLNTISTAGKVSNSATTATSANTVSAIVARDGSGNFSAGTIDATIDEGTF
jgi:hypothetical protein